MTSPRSLARDCLQILLVDDYDLLHGLDLYYRGEHPPPYMPDSANSEYKALAQRAVDNWMPLMVSTPTQALYVDGFRRGADSRNEEVVDGKHPIAQSKSPEWGHWQRSRLDARQAAIYRGALTFGHSFTVTEKRKGITQTRGLSALTTAAIFDDPANDDEPIAALHIVKHPVERPDGDNRPGKAILWTERHRFDVAFRGTEIVSMSSPKLHGSSSCPVTRFAASVDLDGRTVGVIEPLVPIQDRINQTVFDLLVAQTFASFKVRWVTGMAPPVQMELIVGPNGEEEWVPKVGEDGKPIPEAININASRFMFGEDGETKFGTLDETPLSGFIESTGMTIQHLAAISQTPPHHLLGQIANLSAEALQAAEVSLARKIEEFRKSFGESWERVFRLAAELEGDFEAMDDYNGEVLWRDMEARSMAQSADALGKLADQLSIPKRGLWPRVPGVTHNELQLWEDLQQDSDFEAQMAASLKQLGGASGLPSDTRQSATPADQE